MYPFDSSAISVSLDRPRRFCASELSLVDLPTFSPRSSASFLTVSSSIVENASSDAKPANSASTAQSAHGIHHSGLPDDSLDSVSRSERRRSESELLDLFPVSAIEHLPSLVRTTRLSLGFVVPQIGTEHVETEPDDVTVVEGIRLGGLLHGEPMQDCLHQRGERTGRHLATGRALARVAPDAVDHVAAPLLVEPGQLAAKIFAMTDLR